MGLPVSRTKNFFLREILREHPPLGLELTPLQSQVKLGSERAISKYF